MRSYVKQETLGSTPGSGLYFSGCCSGRDGTRFDSECAFIYSDIMVIINQVTPVTIQNKNYIEIIQIITHK